MKNKRFNAVQPTCLHLGSAGELLQWLRAYVDTLFPENGIEYWSGNEYAEGPFVIKEAEVLADIGAVHHVACYAHCGSSEGYIIELQLQIRVAGMRRLCYAKAFGAYDDCWAIARACSDALESIFHYGEAPMIVEIAALVPRIPNQKAQFALAGPVQIAMQGDSVTVMDGSCVLDSVTFPNDGGNYQALAYADDWQFVLESRGIPVKRSQVRFLTAPDLAGYVISDRGVEGCTGFYVLPPGGYEKDDRDYLGYFPLARDALSAARSHLAEVQNASQQAA
ncbi:MAG: hypothetical protein NT159_08240 [Proteobacteria bacterium]|nr:hypothetical protein [Pseudomonadota bacterium]